jgi:hypothetical protein
MPEASTISSFEYIDVPSTIISIVLRKALRPIIVMKVISITPSAI